MNALVVPIRVMEQLVRYAVEEHPADTSIFDGLMSMERRRLLRRMLEDSCVSLEGTVELTDEMVRSCTKHGKVE